jgi:hypothetical protein
VGVLESGWAFWRLDRSLAATGIRNLDRPSRSLFAMSTNVVRKFVAVLVRFIGSKRCILWPKYSHCILKDMVHVFATAS